MRSKSDLSRRRLSVALLSVLMATPAAPARAQAATDADRAPMLTELSSLPESAQLQIAALLAEKDARTPAQRKISSSLLYLAPARARLLASSAPGLRSRAVIGKDGKVAVDILGGASKALITAIEAAGGTMIYGHVDSGVLRALVPQRSLERLAARPDVKRIQPAMVATTQRALALDGTLSALADGGSVISSGDKAHGVEAARHMFGVTGAGVKVGVMSDSDDFKEASIASGDLPADTVTLPGQSGRPGSGEGTAMMEIVHDLAPDAQLFFATAFTSPESFADNIRALRFIYHCDIIVDDVIYYAESPYQDDIVARAVNDVTADGALYFSSAGNGGNVHDGTSGTWEGDFKKSKVALSSLPVGYEAHTFATGIVSNRIEVGGGPLYLHWSDPGAIDNPLSSNDYDLFVLAPDLKSVVVASTDVQDGTGLPFEYLGYDIPAGFQVVVARHAGAADRALHVVLGNGELALGTHGSSYGHNSTTAAFSVAAVDAAQAAGGAFAAGLTTSVETFSSDGPRRVFYDSNGVPYKPGKVTFKGGGGVLRNKPDIAAADGVGTTLPAASGLNPFFGTSAAAPHAAAIAALLKQAKPTFAPAKLRTALTKTGLDIEAPGRDQDAGFGIVDAVAALQNLKAKPMPFLQFAGAAASETAGDGDGFLEPGESASLLTSLKNIGGAAPTNLTGALTTTTAGITITNGASTFPPLAPLGTDDNNTPFTYNIGAGVACGTPTAFELTATYPGGVLSPQVFDFTVPVGREDTVVHDYLFTGPRAAIPDGNANGVNVSIPVSGFPGPLADVIFNIDGGPTCSTTSGSTSAGIDHSWVGDLVLTLTSPAGTSVTLASRIGGTENSGNNLCKTTLSDAAVNSIQNVTIAQAPFSGLFKPASPLSAFDGENPNGTWTLNVKDLVPIDSGGVRAVSLHLKAFVCN